MKQKVEEEDNPGPREGLLSPSKISGSSSAIVDKEMLSFQLANLWKDHGSLVPLVIM